MRLLGFLHLNIKNKYIGFLISLPQESLFRYETVQILIFFFFYNCQSQYAFFVIAGRLPDLVAVEVVGSPDLESVLLQELPKQG